MIFYRNAEQTNHEIKYKLDALLTFPYNLFVYISNKSIIHYVNLTLPEYFLTSANKHTFYIA
jgi:hypothetical protein